jgi:hypothetical protein
MEVYEVNFQGINGSGVAGLVFDNHMIFGVDVGGGVYKGVYYINQNGQKECTIVVDVAPTESVTGVSVMDFHVTLPTMGVGVSHNGTSTKYNLSYMVTRIR